MVIKTEAFEFMDIFCQFSPYYSLISAPLCLCGYLQGCKFFTNDPGFLEYTALSGNAIRKSSR
jgi:hypothetical protein